METHVSGSWTFSWWVTPISVLDPEVPRGACSVGSWAQLASQAPSWQAWAGAGPARRPEGAVQALSWPPAGEPPADPGALLGAPPFQGGQASSPGLRDEQQGPEPLGKGWRGLPVRGARGLLSRARGGQGAVCPRGSSGGSALCRGPLEPQWEGAQGLAQGHRRGPLQGVTGAQPLSPGVAGVGPLPATAVT